MKTNNRKKNVHLERCRCRAIISVAWMCALLGASAGRANAQITANAPVFGPQTYVRTTGAPNVYTTTFAAPAWVVSPYNLHIVNGDASGNNRISSATITLNGVQIAQPSDFNQNVATIDRSVTLQSTNTLQVTLASKPGSYLTINVFGTNGDHTPPQIKIVTPAPSSFINVATPSLEVTYSDPVGPGEVAASGVNTLSFKAVLDGIDRTNLYTVRTTDASAIVPSNLALSAGPHSLVISLQDNAGNQATATSQFTVNLSPPTIQIVQPVMGVYLNNATPTITVQYSASNGIKLSTLEILINGTDLTALFTKTNTGATATLPSANALPQGANQIVAHIQDLAGNQATASTSFNVDTTPPAISFSHPTANSYFGSSTVPIMVQYSDDQAIDTTQLMVTLDGVALSATALPTSATATASGLANGAHKLTATIKDLAGNVASAQITFNVDTTIPTIHVSQPSPGALLSTHTPQVLVDYSDVGGVDLTTLRVAVNGRDATSLFTATTTSATAQLGGAFALPDGQNTITAQIANLVGTAGTTSSTFLVDTTPPTIAIQAPPVKTNSNAPTVTIVYSDATSGVDPNTLVVTLGGGDISSLIAPGASSATGILQLSPPLADGTYVLTATVRDRAGNQSAPATLSFTIDTTPPAATFTAPLNNSFTNNPAPPITVQYSDLGVGVDSTTVKVFLQQGTNPAADITTDLQIGPQQATGTIAAANPLSDGTYALSATVDDLVGNVGKTSATFVLDTVPPTGSIQAPAANAIFNSSVVGVILVYKDDRSGVDTSKLILTVDGVNETSALTLGPAQATGTLPPLADGIHTIQLTVFDRSGNSSGVISQTFETDTTPPTIVASVSPAPNAAGWNNTNVTVTFVCGDATSGVATCPPPQIVTTEGANQIFVATATDNAGNTAATSVALNIAKTPPTVTATAAPAPNASGWNNSNVVVRFTCTVSVAPIATCPPPQTVSTEGAGQIISGTASDVAGNSATATATISLDKTPPAVAITSPSANAILNSQEVLVSGTVSDSLSGVAAVTCYGVAAVLTTNSFSCSLSLTAGSNSIAVQATDVAGNSATAQIAVTVPPSTTPGTVVFTVQPPMPSVQTFKPFAVQVTVEDGSGNVVADFNGPVTVVIGNNPSGAILSGTLTQYAVNGVATFPDLSLNTAGNGYTLLASAAGQSATSAQFNVRVSPQLASCTPTGSLSVLLPASGTGNVTAYVPNGSWSDGHMGIEVVPIEGSGSTSVISTPNPVNSCASNSATGETVCVANNTDVYLISGATLNSTLTSGSSGVTVQFDPPVGPTARPPKTPFLTGGWCLNCGVAINAMTNTAAIEMGLTSGLPPFYSGLQFLDLGTNTFSAPFPLANDITEDMQWDSIRNLILLPSEYAYPTLNGPAPFFGLTGGNYDLIDTSTGTPGEFGRLLPGANLDAAAEDCTTGIALSGIEGTLPPPAQNPANIGLFISDLTQTTLTPGSPGTWSAPGQFVGFPEFQYLNFATGAETPSVSVPPGSHLAVVTSEGAGDGLAVVELPSASGSGTPDFGDYAVAALPRTPDGQSWSQGFDPHTITAYVSPNTGRPMAIFANTSPPTWLAVIDLQGLLDAPRMAGVLPNNLGIPCPTCTHTVDPSYDLLAKSVVRYVGTPPQIALVCPTTGQAGQQRQDVNLTGKQTHWVQGITTASFGAGITVESLVVQDSTQAVATISIDPAADLGPRTVVTVTDSEVAIATNPYMITALASVAPSTGQQGQQNLTVNLTGQFTNWVKGEPNGGITQVSFGAGISVTSVTVNSPTSMTAVLNIDPSAPVGPRPLTITVTSPGCDTQTYTGFFTVTAGALIIESVTPSTGQPGQQNLSVSLTGSGTNWIEGTTTADFGPGITVASLTVTSPTSATAVINIDPSAPQQANTVTITTGSEVEARANGFVITSGFFTVMPTNGQQGQQNLSAIISDEFTYWVPGLTQVDFGPGVTVTSFTVNTQGSISAMLNISPTAPTGPRNVTVTTGAEIDTLSNGFAVVSGSAVLGSPAQVVFVGQPANTTAGQPISAVRVAVEDAFGNVVQTASNTVSVFIPPGSASGTLSGTTSQPAINGIATFGDLSINKSGDYAFQASSPNLSTPRLSSAFAIAPGPATQLVFTAVPSTASAGQPASVEVAIEDAFGNIVTGATNPISLTLATNPGGASLAGTTTAMPSAGIAVFSVSLNKLGQGYSFAASSPGLTSASSASFTVNLGPASQLVFLTQPTSFILNATMNPFQVAVADSGGNIVSSAIGTLSVALTLNPSGGSLSGTSSQPLVNGIATFSGLTVSSIGNAYSLVVSGLGFTALSNPFNVITNVPVPTSIQVTFSDPVVAPGGSTVIAQTVLDQYGNAMSSPSFQFTFSVAANGTTFGNSPVLTGNTVQFPALVKKQIIVDPTIFNEGDTDPTDPNYGKETGGIYTVTVSLQGTTVSGSADVVVLPSGTASTTVEVHQYANKLNAVLVEAAAAIQAQSAAGVSQSISDLQNVKSNPDYSFDILRLNNVMAPPDGLVVGPDMLTAAGFQPGPDDAAFGSSLATLVNQTIQFNAQLAQVDTSAITQADLDALQTMLANYQTLSHQFAMLHPSAIGVAQQSTNVNLLMTYAMPLVLDTISRQLSAALPEISASITARGGRASPFLVQSATLRWTGGSKWQPSSRAPHAARLRTVQFSQLVTFVQTLVNIARDFEGSAKDNIYTVTVSLLNSIANTVIANLINSQSGGTVSIDIVNASSSQTFSCPAYPSTNINAFGCSSTATSDLVVLIGCVNPDSLKAAFNFKPGNGLKAKYGWIKAKIEAIKSLLAIAAEFSPDSVEAGIFSEDGELQLDFLSGWPPVNQSQLPCVGTIVLLNQETGDFTAVNTNFLNSCNTGTP